MKKSNRILALSTMLFNIIILLFPQYSYADDKDDLIQSLQNQISVLNAQIALLTTGKQTRPNFQNWDPNLAYPGYHFICLAADKVFIDRNTPTYSGISPKLDEAQKLSMKQCTMYSKNDYKCNLIDNGCHQELN